MKNIKWIGNFSFIFSAKILSDWNSIAHDDLALKLIMPNYGLNWKSKLCPQWEYFVEWKYSSKFDYFWYSKKVWNDKYVGALVGDELKNLIIILY